MKPILVPYDENMTKEELLKAIADAVGSDVESVKKELCEPKTEPSADKSSSVDKDINVRSKDEQTDIHDLTDCDFCKERNCADCEGGKDESTGYNLQPVDKDVNVRSKDEQTERSE